MRTKRAIETTIEQKQLEVKQLNRRYSELLSENQIELAKAYLQQTVIVREQIKTLIWVLEN